jgi:hypothetical protein
VRGGRSKKTSPAAATKFAQRARAGFSLAASPANEKIIYLCVLCAWFVVVKNLKVFFAYE